MTTLKSWGRVMRRNQTIAAVCGAMLLLACSEPTAPALTGGPQAAKPIGNNGGGFGNHEPIHVVAGAPALERTSASFWAVQGRHRKVTIRHEAEPDGTPGKVFLEFAVPSRTQLVAPDGRALARGDSILITVQVDSTRLQAGFSPDGLAFTGLPAELMVSTYYGDTRGRPKEDLKIWYLPVEGPPEPQPSRVDPRAHSVSAGLRHFSNYAVAY